MSTIVQEWLSLQVGLMILLSWSLDLFNSTYQETCFMVFMISKFLAQQNSADQLETQLTSQKWPRLLLMQRIQSSLQEVVLDKLEALNK